jgi:hypothetical protein
MEDHAVTEPASPAAPPAWVTKRDGRLVPFEADKISRALFAATEELGQPDAFLARELTDSVVHFLTAEADAIPTTVQVADLVVKIVRELGQPALAAAFANGLRKRRPRALQADADVPETAPLAVHFSAADPLPAVLDDCVRQYTLQRVFARDLVAAHRDGLLTLGGLDAPFELAGCVLAPPADLAQGLVETIEDARSLTGKVLAIDGTENLLAEIPDETARWARELGIGLRATGFAAVVNLNAGSPPPWADDLAEGPLFAARRAADQRLPALADALLERLLQPGPTRDRLRIDWHLADRDFQAGSEERLLRVARRVVAAEPLALVFDRPRRPVALAEGIDRQHTGVLLGVRVHLPRLLAQPGVNGDAERFLHKLGSLARLALSAAVQKRDFLRRHRPALSRGFLLDRARLVVTPEGLCEGVRALAGRDLASGGPALEFARRVLQRLRDVLRHDGLACRIIPCLDAAPGLHAPEAEGEETATVKQQLRAAGSLHAVAEGGTVGIALPEERPPSAEQVADWLRWAWQQTDVGRVRFLRAAPTQEQLTVPWPEP